MLSAEQWNELVPVGTPVRYWPVKTRAQHEFEGERYQDTRTASVAWELGHGGTVVKVDGVSGGVCVGHLAVKAAELSPAATTKRLDESHRREDKMADDVVRAQNALRALWAECVFHAGESGQAPSSEVKAQCERALGCELSDEDPGW